MLQTWLSHMHVNTLHIAKVFENISETCLITALCLIIYSVEFSFFPGMRFTGPPAQVTPSSCSPNNKVDLVNSPYYKAQSAAYFRNPSATSAAVSLSNNIHSFPTPPPTMPASYYDTTKCAPAPVTGL